MSSAKKENHSLYYLWGHELGGTAESSGRVVASHVLLAETVIGNLDVSVEGQEDVVELQVTVDDIVVVEILQRQTDFGSIEPGKR